MNLKKITLDQISVETSDIFYCSIDKSHLVEQPIACPNIYCQQLICKTCFLEKCPRCGTGIFVEMFPAQIKEILNKIILKCENWKNGCDLKIYYENYRNHIEKCKFKKTSFNIHEIIDNKDKISNEIIKIESDNEENENEMKKNKTGDLEKIKENLQKDIVKCKKIEEIIQTLKFNISFLGNREKSFNEKKSNTDSEIKYSDEKLRIFEKQDFYLFSNIQLKQILRQRNIAVSGDKEFLINKLLSHLSKK